MEERTEDVDEENGYASDEQECTTFHRRIPLLPHELRFISCGECQGLHCATARCIACNAPLFEDDRFCWNCGRNVLNTSENADGECTNCYNRLLSGVALNTVLDDYRCPGCGRNSEEGAKFRFRTEQLQATFNAGKAAGERASDDRERPHRTMKDEDGGGYA